MTYYIGVDPGAKGYLCLLDPIGKMEFIPNPTTQKEVTDSTLALLAHIHLLGQPIRVGIEDVHSLYGMSAKSNFNFGFNLGMITTLLYGMFPKHLITKVQPKVWQKAIGAPSKKFLGGQMKLKQAIADIAEAIYPHADLYGPKGGLKDGKADALMIAHYLYLQDRGPYDFITKTT